jgi:transposase-like protein
MDWILYGILTICALIAMNIIVHRNDPLSLLQNEYDPYREGLNSAPPVCPFCDVRTAHRTGHRRGARQYECAKCHRGVAAIFNTLN